MHLAFIFNAHDSDVTKSAVHNDVPITWLPEAEPEALRGVAPTAQQVAQ